MFKQPVGNSLDGICRFFYTYFRPQLDTLVNVTPSSFHWGNPQNLVHYDFTNNEMQESFATSNTSPNQNIIFMFTQHILRITHYSLTTRLSNESNQFTSWTFQGSKDMSQWDTLDSQNNYTDFTKANLTRTFPVSKRNIYKYILKLHK